MKCTCIDTKRYLQGKQGYNVLRQRSTKFGGLLALYRSYANITVHNSSQPTVQWEMELQQPRTVKTSPQTPSHEPANAE